MEIKHSSFFGLSPYPTTFLEMFDAQVIKTPREVALICGEERLTYQQLEQRANQLAGYLISLGVLPNTIVGVCTSRSLDMVVAILGIIKAGGAYLPLDPNYPVDRLSFILGDARVGIIVTQQEFVELYRQPGIVTVVLDTDDQKIAGFPTSRPEISVTAENLVYVIYTSGSTGRPKGVMITHSNLSNFVEIVTSALEVNPDDIYLHSASISYALSVRQLMIPLAVGATIVIAPQDDINDPLAMFGLIKKRGVTLMDMVPSFWRLCTQRLSYLTQKELRELLDNSLRRIVSVGEMLTSDLCYGWAVRFGQKQKLVNIFGQTETTGVVATFPIPQDMQETIGVVPIGRSVQRTNLYILDDGLKPVPDGYIGELCVSSPCLALGYLNQPELTSEKFIVNPFNDGYSTRLYRTGDMARRRKDGVIELLGRGDHQVKIRGQRVELGEVELALRAHSAIHDCVVVAYTDDLSEKYLVAYCTFWPGEKVDSVELKKFVRKSIPEYMVPPKFVFLDALPRTPNGKVDRLTLSASKPLENKSEAEEDKEKKALNETEEVIKAIWRDIMNLDDMSVHDDFFDLGGHSLMAVRILACIERDFGVRLPLTSFFHSTTISKLADLVTLKVDESHEWSPLVPIRTVGYQPPFFGIHAHEGGVLFWRNIVKYLPEDQPFYALQAQGVDGIRPALTRIEDMARLYVDAIRKIRPQGPYYLGGFSMGGEIAFEMAQQLLKMGEKVDLLVMLDTRNPARSVRKQIRTMDGKNVPIVDEPLPSSEIEILKRKAHGHFQKLTQLSTLDKLSYIGNQITVRVRRAIIRLSVKPYRWLGKRLPDFLLLPYLKEAHTEALVNYLPTLYPGRITIFRASESLTANPTDDPMGWANLAGDGVDVHYFDAPHNLVQPEYSEVVAQKLEECIAAVRHRTSQS